MGQRSRRLLGRVRASSVVPSWGRGRELGRAAMCCLLCAIRTLVLGLMPVLPPILPRPAAPPPASGPAVASAARGHPPPVLVGAAPGRISQSVRHVQAHRRRICTQRVRGRARGGRGGQSAAILAVGDRRDFVVPQSTLLPRAPSLDRDPDLAFRTQSRFRFLNYVVLSLVPRSAHLSGLARAPAHCSPPSACPAMCNRTRAPSQPVLLLVIPHLHSGRRCRCTSFSSLPTADIHTYNTPFCSALLMCLHSALETASCSTISHPLVWPVYKDTACVLVS